MGREFDLIDQFFGLRSGAAINDHLPIGIGDDCAAVRPSPNHVLLTSVDTLNEGVHFFAGTDPVAIGHKALAVNLSDLAACGAEPLGCLLALSLPKPDPDWLAGFSRGFLDLAREAGCPLIGGDTTRSSAGGGLSVSVTVLGQVPTEADILRRSGAQPGDQIWVSGQLGGAAWAVAGRQAGESGVLWPADQAVNPAYPAAWAIAQGKLDWPAPRLALGKALRGIASACIDVSDGLSADLGHILTASGAARGQALGALLHEDRLPVSPGLRECQPDRWLPWVLGGGDDYELCFTAAPVHFDRIVDLSAQLDLPLTPVGMVQSPPGLFLQTTHQGVIEWEPRAYEHF